ncbi:MAG: sulfatase-like hydrolase/transferase [Planctomycetes bacterium]|nr:sulfatase-like hydrolase/transferase [Planctomycetota bacterium]
MRGRWLTICLAAAGLVPAFASLGLGAAASGGGQARPNVLFILADDLGWGDLSCYGHRELRTPNLDRLAAEGTRLTQFHVCSGVCSPSRTAFMTGRYPARLAIHGHLARPDQNAARGMPNWLDPAAGTLPKLLKQAGYATAHFGKWHLGHGADAPSPDQYGFNAFRAVNANPEGFKAGEPYFRANSTQYIFDETIKFIEQHREGPFYVQAWLLLPHATLNPTEEQMEPYARFGPTVKVPYKGTKQIYYASVGAIDREIGRLMAKLGELGVADNTIVVFSSDNGPEDIAIGNATHSGIGSPGPLRGRKRSLYEGGVRVPFIVRWPGTTPQGKVDNTSVVAGCDFLPTFCAIAGVKLPEGLLVDGEDRSAVLRGEASARTKPLMWEWRFSIANHVWNKSPILSIREGDYKLLMNPDRSRVELYDIPRDPSEYNNLADKHPDVVERMAAQVLAWQKTLPPGPMDRDAGSNVYPWPK